MVRLQQLPLDDAQAPAAYFQSHYGAIATSGLAANPDKLPFLSIPLWCDCNMLLDALAELQVCPFNPTMVRLQRRLGKIAGGCLPSFNPTMVRLQP